MNLRRYMRRRRLECRPFTETEVRDAMAQLLSAVARSHDAGMVKGEIVPENVNVDDQQQPQIKRKKSQYTIRGLNVSDQQTGRDETGGGSNKDGSLPNSYRAPELFFGSDGNDPEVDTWGLGGVMAELLHGGTGHAPFFGTGPDDDVFPGILLMVGAKGIVEWPGLERLVTPAQETKLRELYGRDTGRLRKEFPKTLLSQAGFDVLSGLLQSNPDRRLSAAAALRMPWFRPRCLFGACFTSRV
ncbi:hypothetical protein QOZ80_5BG0434090 [Eleusine coracana subsp. coracana]|nr:hypothetical protein QOZ80_5BG0434090 [Eleusine coracana subsp. coracana]